jgi:D-sedoheptulose 7-phosphate isomerase
METWADYVSAIGAGLSGLVITDRRGETLSAAAGFGRWVEITHQVQTSGRHVYLIGNGASAAMASHFAADACKNGGLRAQAFNDGALLTCAGNDAGFDEVFSLPLSRFAREGDLLITISSSGASPNILRALKCARETRLQIVTLSGKSLENPSRMLGDINFYMPATRYGWIESGHHVVLHYWLDQYLGRHGQGAV